MGMDLYNHMSECIQVEVHSTKLTPNMKSNYGLHWIKLQIKLQFILMYKHLVEHTGGPGGLHTLSNRSVQA